jgi:hypothetical protein
MKKEYAEAEQEEIANPYNSNKLWHTNKKEKVLSHLTMFTTMNLKLKKKKKEHLVTIIKNHKKKR